MVLGLTDSSVARYSGTTNGASCAAHCWLVVPGGWVTHRAANDCAAWVASLDPPTLLGALTRVGVGVGAGEVAATGPGWAGVDGGGRRGVGERPSTGICCAGARVGSGAW